jgi:hypothetical protein
MLKKVLELAKPAPEAKVEALDSDDKKELEELRMQKIITNAMGHARSGYGMGYPQVCVCVWECGCGCVCTHVYI